MKRGQRRLKSGWMRNRYNFRSARFVGCLLLCAWARESIAGAAPDLPPTELVRQAVNNEMSANTGPAQRFMFKNERKTPYLTQTKLIIETQDATAGILILQNGQPLNPQQR